MACAMIIQAVDLPQQKQWALTMENGNPADDDPSRWHLDKRVNLAHIVTTASIAIAAVVAWFQIQERVAVLEVRGQIAASEREQSKRDIALLIERVRQDIAALRAEVRDELRHK